jgi:hypothetical protein
MRVSVYLNMPVQIKFKNLTFDVRLLCALDQSSEHLRDGILSAKEELPRSVWKRLEDGSTGI